MAAGSPGGRKRPRHGLISNWVSTSGSDDKQREGFSPKRNSLPGAAPLAERVRPERLDDLCGQHHLLNEDAVFRKLVKTDRIPSMILWGPPGCGKTTLARVLAKESESTFVTLSAVNAGVGEVKNVIRDAGERWKRYNLKSILFLDEVHRFNKAQQDCLLPAVENGTIILIGATTENPSFEVNAALLSRTRVFKLERVEPAAVVAVLTRAINSPHGYESTPVRCEPEALQLIAILADGDARSALNMLEVAVESTSLDSEGVRRITVPVVKKSVQRVTTMYDKKGEEHYNIISALHKSMRGSDDNAAIYWLGRMLESGEDPKYIARRLVRFASEDVGMADVRALEQAVAAFRAVEVVGMPEVEVCLAQCVVYLARAPKSVEIYKAYKAVKESIRTRPNEPVPMHIRNAPTKLMKDFGYNKGYVYNPEHDYMTGEELGQVYLPEAIKHVQFLPKEVKQATSLLDQAEKTT